MVPLQASFCQGEKRVSPNLEAFSSKKRKWQDEGEESRNDVALNLEAPLPLEWQRCLDIKSGQIHFYNTRTHKRTSKDPRSASEVPLPSSHPSLDLELNLNLKYCSNNEVALPKQEPRHEDQRRKYENNNIGITIECDRKEMVAAVCVKCHVLVMMCKESLSCPNCKFVHDAQVQSSSLVNRTEFRLLCCKD